MSTKDWIDILNAKPWAAFLFVSLSSNVLLLRLYVRSVKSHMDDLRTIAPIADQVTALSSKFSSMIANVKRRRINANGSENGE